MDEERRLQMIAEVEQMIKDGKPTAEIITAVICHLTPEDDEECPVCGGAV